MRVAALFRYPVKGFTREECDSLQVLPGGRIAGDRVLGLRFNDATIADDAWGTKQEFVAVVNTPGLTPLQLKFDHQTLRLRIQLANEVLLDDVLDEAGRTRFVSIIAQYVVALGDNPLSSRMNPLPLRVVGDGITSRYQDREPGYTTLHARSSVAALANAIAEAPDVTEKRFRSNIAIDGAPAWDEQSWIGRNVRVGEVDFKVTAPVTRCLATHAHPTTGSRDQPIMKTLLRLFPAGKPTFAILMTSDRGGSIRVGDHVEVNS